MNPSEEYILQSVLNLIKACSYILQSVIEGTVSGRGLESTNIRIPFYYLEGRPFLLSKSIRRLC